MKIYFVLILLLLLNNSVNSRILSKRNEKESPTIIDKKDELYFEHFSPFEKGALIVSNFMVGFFSHFISELEGAREIFLEFLSFDGKCSFDLLKRVYNNIKIQQEIAIWKDVKECQKSINKQKEYAEKLVMRRMSMIVKLERMNKNATTEEEIIENTKIADELFEKLDQENKELIEKENYDCKKEIRKISYPNKIYRKLKHLLIFYDEALGPCFQLILNKTKHNLLKKIGISLALKGINILSKLNPLFTIAKFGTLFFVLIKKIYGFVKVLKSKNHMNISFALGNLTGVIVDILSGGVLSR